jgi:hypothetical protein
VQELAGSSQLAAGSWQLAAEYDDHTVAFRDPLTAASFGVP